MTFFILLSEMTSPIEKEMKNIFKSVQFNKTDHPQYLKKLTKLYEKVSTRRTLYKVSSRIYQFQVSFSLILCIYLIPLKINCVFLRFLLTIFTIRIQIRLNNCAYNDTKYNLFSQINSDVYSDDFKEKKDRDCDF